MLIPDLRPERDNFVRPPGDSDGVFGVQSGVAGTVADDIIKDLIPNREEAVWPGAEHDIVERGPLWRITAFEPIRRGRKGAVLVGHSQRRRGCRVMLEHV